MNFVFRESFEFMRFDFLVDKDLKAWVIEVSYIAFYLTSWLRSLLWPPSSFYQYISPLPDGL